MSETRSAQPGGQRRLPPDPPIGRDGARQMGYTDDEYGQAEEWYNVLWRRHLDADRPGAPERLTRTDLKAFLDKGTSLATGDLDEGARDELDPCLGSAKDALVDAASTLDQLELPDQEVKADGAMWKVVDARQMVMELTLEIQRDTDEGHTHHRRTPIQWKRVSSTLMLLDFAAIVLIFADLFNIDYRRPFDDPLGFLTTVFLPSILVSTQLWLSISTGHTLNDLRQKRVRRDGSTGKQAQRATIWAAVTSVVVLVVTALLVLRLWTMSEDADLDTLWQIVFTGLAVAIGIGAPLIKVGVVAGDGSTSSRRRDELEDALDELRAAQEDAVHHVRDCLDMVSRAHGDYISELRPNVLFGAGGALVEGENSLGLLGVLLGAEIGDGSRRDRAAIDDDPDFPLLRWSYMDAPAIDNGPLQRRDRTYREQVSRSSALQNRLAQLA